MDGKKQSVTEEVQAEIDLREPRDIYNRPGLLKTQIEKVETLDEPDKSDVLKFVQHMNDNRNAALTIVGKISRLITMRDRLKRSFRNATVEDIRNLFEEIENVGYKRKTKKKIETQCKKYSAAAIEKFRKVIKEFYKVVFGKGEFYPDQVKWIKTKSKKDNPSKKLDFRNVLNHEQIIELVRKTQGLQRKAFLSTGYELGARPEEHLRLTNLDIRYETDGIYCKLIGKTGKREIKVEEFEVQFKQWLENHPLKYQNIFPIWISEATNHKNQPLGLRGAEKIAEEMIPQVDPNKIATLYTLRHSRATFLAKCGLNEAFLRIYFGWSKNSDEPSTYIHLSGRDLNAALSKIYGREQAKEEKDIIAECLRCKEKLSPGLGFCGRCGKDVSIPEAYTKNVDNIEEIKVEFNDFKIEMQRQMNFVIDQMQKYNMSKEKLVKPNSNNPNDYKVVFKGEPVRGEKNKIFVKLEDMVLLEPSENGEINLVDEHVETMVYRKKQIG